MDLRIAPAVVILAALAAPVAVAAEKLPPLPAPAFEVVLKQSDFYRTARSADKPYDGPLFDTQTHLRRPGGGRDRDEYLADIIDTMAGNGVTRMMVMGTPNSGRRDDHRRSADYRQSLAKRSGGSIGVLCGGNFSYWLHRAFRDGYEKAELEEILSGFRSGIKRGRCRGLGEIGLFHFDKNGKQPVIQYPPNFPPFLAFLGLAAETGVWAMVHAETVEPEGKSHARELFGAVGLWFARYPKLKLILAHSAMTNVANVRRLLTLYPGLAMEIKTAHKPERWHHLESITDARFRLFADWAQLFEAMPGRFTISTDAKFGRKTRRYSMSRYGEEIRRMRHILGSLKPGVARMIGFDNAARMFGPRL